jgi:predicted enzyme related to lactoylglutathione lyase
MVLSMFKKIDCVMIRVDDVDAAVKFYSEVLGMKPLWSDNGATGMAFPETDTEIVLHSNADIPHKVEVHYLVDDVEAAVRICAEKGCRIVEPPFDILIGKCAVISDPFGTVLCLLDTTSGRRPAYLTYSSTLN